MKTANMKIEPGIMAIQFGLIDVPEENGNIVNVVAASEYHEDYWVVVCDTPSLVLEDGHRVNVSRGEEVEIKGKNLMPIRPEEDPLEGKIGNRCTISRFDFT